MTTTPTGIITNTADSPFGTTLNSLASGSAVLSSAIDNTAATVGHAAYDLAEVWITLTGGITTGSGSPYVQAAVVASLNGTNYEINGVANSQVFPIPGSGTEPLLPSTSVTYVRVKGLILPPALFKVYLLNLAGVAFAATTTATVYRMQGGIG